MSLEIEARHGGAWQGLARHGQARRGMARQGKTRYIGQYHRQQKQNLDKRKWLGTKK